MTRAGAGGDLTRYKSILPSGSWYNRQTLWYKIKILWYETSFKTGGVRLDPGREEGVVPIVLLRPRPHPPCRTPPRPTFKIRFVTRFVLGRCTFVPGSRLYNRLVASLTQGRASSQSSSSGRARTRPAPEAVQKLRPQTQLRGHSRQGRFEAEAAEALERLR